MGTVEKSMISDRWSAGQTERACRQRLKRLAAYNAVVGIVNANPDGIEIAELHLFVSEHFKSRKGLTHAIEHGALRKSVRFTRRSQSGSGAGLIVFPRIV